MNIQDLISGLQKYWKEKGCIIIQPYDVETGAGTFNPATFFGSLGEEPLNAAYVELSRRPPDGRYGENPLRTRLHHQFQVIQKPPPEDIQNLYLDSLRYVGIDLELHDVRFVDDNWESPTLGARGTGWEVWIDGLEITQFTYFQKVGGFDLNPVTVELAYGLERVAMFLKEEDSCYQLDWGDKVTYGSIFKEKEKQFSIYNFEIANIEKTRERFRLSEQECKLCLKEGLVYPAYDQMLKCAHLFNVLLARKAVSVTERESYIARIRELSRQIASMYLKTPEDEAIEKRSII